MKSLLHMTTALLDSTKEERYESFLKAQENMFLSYSTKFKNMLIPYLGDEPKYFLAECDGEITGILPAFLKRNKKYGNVINSLPFFGSHGGVVCKQGMPQSKVRQTKELLIQKFNSFAIEQDVISSTIITSPFENDIEIYNNHTQFDYLDSRIGQITHLPDISDSLDSTVMDLIHSKTRNIIRKAVKSGVSVRYSSSTTDLKILADFHKENMNSINVLSKDWSFFQLVTQIFDHDTDYRLYMAELDGKIIAGLLLFYINQTVEYYIPAVNVEYRNLQANSLLIYEAMKDAIQRGFKYYSFGGTQRSNKGVYNFKKRWGAIDYEYTYFIRIYDKSTKYLSPEVILQEYPNYYIIPFSELNNNG